jgi:antitoxin (DNA-binding transcriptional repressor) of toxin-antitoxin stability system
VTGTLPLHPSRAFGACAMRTVDAFRLPTYHRVMSTHRVNLDQSRDQSDLITAASEGGEIIIEQNGKALARLVPATDSIAYRSHPPVALEFATDDEALAWDAEGWENVA